MTQPSAPPSPGAPWPATPPPQKKRPAWQWVVPLVALVIAVPLALLPWLTSSIRDPVTTSPEESSSQAAEESAQTAANEAELAGVQTDVGGLSGVTAAELEYVQSLDVSGAVVARLSVDSLDEVAAAREGLVQRLWLSQIDPLRYDTLTTTVAGAGSGDQPDTENIRFTGPDGSELEEQYGPRPR